MEATLDEYTILADHQSSQESSEQNECPYYSKEEFFDGNNISEKDLEQVQALLLRVRALLMNKTDAKRVTLPMVMDKDLEAKTSSSKIKEPESKQNSVLFVRGTHDNEASTSKASVIQANKQPTLPRRAYKQKSTPYSDVKKRWVPKAVLRAQGYYQGAKLVRIPKAKPLTPPTLPTESKTPKTKDTLLGEP